MNYAQVRKYDTANGPGIRTTIFVSGCTHNCFNCFNKEYQNFGYGKPFNSAVLAEILENLRSQFVKGLSVLGGEPLQMPVAEMVDFLSAVRKTLRSDQDIWLYSGYTWEELQGTNKLDIVKLCDFLVDGRFIEALKNLRLRFRGSSNQRIINIQQTLQQNKIILWEDE